MEDADVLLSFGADFLETWLSPVEYARKFKAMHAMKAGKKGLFFHISPYQSLTAANADLWISCRPGTEAAVALCLLEEALHLGKGESLTTDLRSEVEKAVAPFTREKTLAYAEIETERYERLLTRLIQAQKPLILGSNAAVSDPFALQTEMAVNLLNLVLDPNRARLDFGSRYRVQTAVGRSEAIDFFKALDSNGDRLLLLNNVNPVYALPPASGVQHILQEESLFVVSFSNFMDETSALADLIFPVALPLETWDEYAGRGEIASTIQPAMPSLTGAPHLGDVFLRTAFAGSPPTENYRTYLFAHIQKRYGLKDEMDWVQTLQQGGIFEPQPQTPKETQTKSSLAAEAASLFAPTTEAFSSKEPAPELTLVAAPSIRYFDGRGANRPWLNEVPEPLTRVAWQSPVLMHAKTLSQSRLEQGDVIEIRSAGRSFEAAVYRSEGVRPGVLVMSIGQGHADYGRYAEKTGANPLHLFSPEAAGATLSGAPVTIHKTGRRIKLAHTDGNRVQLDRKIALSVSLDVLNQGKPHEKQGLSMWEFPFTIPLPEGYNPKRDLYPPHEHTGYRWSMVVDLDRCIGCGACAVACYAENNLGVVGLKRVVEGREMAWLSIERYLDPQNPEQITFLPMLCQHCDNAPCESVCPVYAPHHNKEGMNNQIYNRCIGTRFCSQNCPYKVRRFNWFTWKWPGSLNLQLNPDVTVRSKGVMEKCSFCIQRIKAAHNVAKNEKRKIKDGEITPACVQTCPTNALTFGNLMDLKSRVRQMTADPRAYQIMGYLNTKPAVIYLKKVLQEI
jgi:molybdopterin-containing oxidoreductase family iron-sulfur binding subunit